MSQSRQAELRHRIRGLTTVLYKFEVLKQPSKRPRSAHSLLPHVTTLLTCSDQYDKEAKKVISVATSVEPGLAVRILVVVQNARARSSVESISVQVVEKRQGSFDEVVTGPANRNFMDHIADVQAALSAFDARATDADDRLNSLEIFFLLRSFPKFIARFNEDTRLCGGKQLFEVIREWNPARGAKILPRLFDWPDWLGQFKALPPIPSRVVDGRVKCEFSDVTKRMWSEILAAFLVGVDKSIGDVKLARGRGEEGEEAHREMRQLNEWCRGLYYFIYWEAGIVQKLLTKTTMLNSITVPAMLDKTASTMDDDESAELRLEPDENKGERVLRYLKRVVAWHAAVDTLCNHKATPRLLENIVVGVIEVPRSLSSVMTLPEISDEFFVRFPQKVKSHEDVVETLADHCSDNFPGCVHAEATLMGLLNYCSHYLAHASQDVEIQNPEMMRQFVQPVAEAKEIMIAVNKKSCWCCDWLSRNLESQFALPGTHGIMYPWDPPEIGVSEIVLERLEDELWNKLHEVVSNSLPVFNTPKNPMLITPTPSEFMHAKLKFLALLQSRCQ